jgi:hypothetical protein
MCFYSEPADNSIKPRTKVPRKNRNHKPEASAPDRAADVQSAKAPNQPELSEPSIQQQMFTMTEFS